MTFLAPAALWGLLALPLLVGLYTAVIARRAKLHPTSFEMVASGASSASDRRPAIRRRHVPAAIFLVAVAALLFSLGRPEMNLTLPVRTGKVILAFDTSNSMIADDVEPNRLDVAKAIATDFVNEQPGSVQVGVVAFTNGGLVVQPPTKNQRDVIAAVERLKTDGGTSIGEGIFAALTAISPEPIEIDPEVVALDLTALDIGYFSNAAIVVLTDGEEIGGADPMELAGLAANAGVKIYTVGIGTPRGTVVALDGFSIATALNEPRLTAIAESTGGEYLLAANDPDLTAIFDAIDRDFERQGERVEVTALVAMLGIVLLLIAGGLSMRWFGRVP